jgi:NAD(P)-dependent dehydrogenase (short-subunit alcohol dehydrogenase family)
MTGGAERRRAQDAAASRPVALDNPSLIAAAALSEGRRTMSSYLKDPDIRESRREAVPLGRIGQPADISNGILYLLSDAASWITATTLTVDGGVSKSLFNYMKGRRWS